MLEVLLNVLAVIGIIVVGGFVVIFLGNVLLTVLDSDNSKKSRKEPDQQPTYMINQGPVPMQIQEPVRLIEEPRPEPVMTQYADVDFEKAKEEERLLYGFNTPQPKQEPTEDAFAKLRAEEEAFRQERLRFIEERRKIEEEERAKQEAEEAQRQKEIDELDLDDIFFDDDDEEEVAPVEETVEQPVIEEDFVGEEISLDDIMMTDEEQTTPAEEVTAPAEEPVDPEIQKIDAELEEIADELGVEEDKTTDDEKLKELEAELEKQRAELEEFKKRAEEERQQLIAEKEELMEQLKQTENKEVEVSEANLSLEEYEARLATLQERLKANDKELKASKKEYLPLARVRKSLENDRKKLRRREALVAKQKVVLYGVNNYVDIDEEKAKKLAEDLDLLDGLRVSVQHCEDVMAQNAERLPILERTYNILIENQKNLKADIADVEAKIAELKAQADGDTDGEAPVED